MTSRPCVGSGMCCKTAPCAFGTWDPARRQCAFLITWEGDALVDGEGVVPRYRCGKHDEIVQDPTSVLSPAFGAGCCMPLFNDARDRIVRAQNLTARHARLRSQ